MDAQQNGELHHLDGGHSMAAYLQDQIATLSQKNSRQVANGASIGLVDPTTPLYLLLKSLAQLH
jgi:hypothetical protein